MLHGYRLASRNERAGGETGSARQSSARRPSAIDPTRCRAPSYALRAEEEYAVRVDLAGLPWHHSRGHLTRNRADGVDGHRLPATVGWRQPAPVLAVSRYDWRRELNG